MRGFWKVLLCPILAIGLLSTSAPVAQSNPKCSTKEMKLYKKAKKQFITANTVIQYSYDIKELVALKYEGSSRHYAPQDIYRLEKADKDIDEWRDHRSYWEPVLRQMAKRCGFKMTSRSELLPSYYEPY